MPFNTSQPPISPSRLPAYRLVLVQRILAICSQSTAYGSVANFKRYPSVLARISSASVGQQMRNQLVGVVG
jgi:AP-3 complex subunit delta